jgi:AcrR family transcriptional regulator
MKAINSDNRCKWRRRKEARPAEIIDAALDLFVVNGFSATKLDEVARMAGVSKGTVYLYFESKEALLREAVKQIIVPEVVKAEQQAADFTGSQTELLTTLIFNWWEAVGKTRLAGIPKLMVSEAANFPELAEFYLETVVSRARNLIAKTIKNGIESGEFRVCDPIATTRLLIAPLVFAVIWEKSLGVYDKEEYDVEEYIRLHIDIFLKGLSAG